MQQQRKKRTLIERNSPSAVAHLDLEDLHEGAEYSQSNLMDLPETAIASVFFGGWLDSMFVLSRYEASGPSTHAVSPT
jgi:hypothetical protein